MNCQDYIKQPSVTDADIATYQRKYARRLKISSEILPRLRGPVPRVGFHCSFMDSDTIRFQMRPAWLKRRNIELIGYAPRFGTVDDCFDAMRLTGRLSDRAFCEQVRRDNVDILVELSGFSPGHRFGAMATRCAPVQVSYLNHPASCGVPNVDYIFADRYALPSWEHFTEKPYFLDGCLFHFNYGGSVTPDVTEPPCLRNGFITYGCFGSLTKLNKPLIELWADILRYSGGRLILQNEGVEKVRPWFGDVADQVEIRSPTDRMGTLAAYADVDISLDTFPYCGGNTIAESFWMGVPVVTLRGDRFASAYGSSLVRTAGYPELIALNGEDYFSKAVGLDARWLARERFLTRSKGWELWDSASFASRLEQACHDLLEASSASDIPGYGIDHELQRSAAD